MTETKGGGERHRGWTSGQIGPKLRSDEQVALDAGESRKQVQRFIRLTSLMSYGWATVFTLAAWFAGLVIDANVRVGDLGLRTVLPVIVMGCCVMKYIKDNSK